MNAFSNPSIAIVDDSAAVRTFTGFLLSHHDYLVAFEAENGQQCIDHMNQSETLPGLIILDLEMPVMDGFKTAEILKANWPDVKIVALSNFNDAESIAKITAAGADFFITKEKDITDKLIKTIRRLLN